MVNINDILPKLKKLKGRGPQWTALCPAHDDGKNSLSIADASGKVLMHCHAGCTFTEIIQALGIEQTDRKPLPPRKPMPAMTERKVDPDKLSDMWAKWATGTTDVQIGELSGELGVTIEALRMVGCCWAWPYTAWGFPMFDGNEVMIGMRLRGLDGAKWAVPGSNEGIFTSGTANEPFCIVEGPTDLAALFSIGLTGLGRPNCQGAVAHTVDFCRRHRVTPYIIADNDAPGKSGALELQKKLPGSKVFWLSSKDLRAYVNEGGTKEMLMCSLRAL